MRLASNNGEEQVWISAKHVTFTLHGGQIVRTLGLEHDLDGLGLPNTASPAAALKQSLTVTRLADFSDIGRYSAKIVCAARVVGHRTIVVNTRSVGTEQVDEHCSSPNLKWDFLDHFWIEPESGVTWRSLQHVHPEGGEITIELLSAPPAAP